MAQNGAGHVVVIQMGRISIDLAKYVDHTYASGQFLESDVVTKAVGAYRLIKVWT